MGMITETFTIVTGPIPVAVVEMVAKPQGTVETSKPREAVAMSSLYKFWCDVGMRVLNRFMVERERERCTVDPCKWNIFPRKFFNRIISHSLSSLKTIELTQRGSPSLLTYLEAYSIVVAILFTYILLPSTYPKYKGHYRDKRRRFSHIPGLDSCADSSPDLVFNFRGGGRVVRSRYEYLSAFTEL